VKRRKPNIILLDFYDRTGNVPFNYAASLNSIANPSNTVTIGTASATASQTAVVSSSSLTGAGLGVYRVDRFLGYGLGVTGLVCGMVGVVF